MAIATRFSPLQEVCTNTLLTEHAGLAQTLKSVKLVDCIFTMVKTQYECTFCIECKVLSALEVCTGSWDEMLTESLYFVYEEMSVLLVVYFKSIAILSSLTSVCHAYGLGAREKRSCEIVQPPL